MSNSNSSFGSVREILWPVYSHEFKKSILIILMFCFIIFNYTILRDTKDTLIITAVGGGTELIPFLKLWGVLPVAFMLIIFYINLSNKLSKTSLFYVSLTPFIIFFALFATVLYPYRNDLHPNQFCDKLVEISPVGLHGLVGALRNWTFSLFYIIAELWGSVVLSLLGWGVANDITEFSESKRLYPLINLLTNFAIIVAGFFTEWVSNLKLGSNSSTDSWQLSLNYLMLAVVVSGFIIMIIYRYLIQHAGCNNQPLNSTKSNKTKKKQSMLTSLKQVVSSRYLRYIAIIVVAYGFCINFIEVIWKSQIKLQYPDPNAYIAFMGGISKYTGIFSFLMLLFVGNKMLSKFSWKTNALITPIMILITGSIFFVTVIFNSELTGILAYLGTTPLTLAVIFGAGQNIAAKSCKYSFFDCTKEMVYIPLSEDEKVKGKAAVDVLASRLGKSGASFMQQFMILCFGSLLSITSYIAVILLLITVVWIFAVESLSNKFTILSDQYDIQTQDKSGYTKKTTKEYAYENKKHTVNT